MRKKDKLYTINKFNRSMFLPEGNMFLNGGAVVAADQLASKAYGANYGDEGFTLDGYMSSKNALGISKADNPFSKMNLKGGIGAMASTPIGGSLVSGLAGAVGGLANSAISGGLESGAGSAISSIGSTVGSAVGAVNPLLGAAVGVGSQLVGGLVNRAFGTKVDQAKLNAVNEGINANKNFTSDEGSFDAIKGPAAVVTDTSAYSGGWFSGGKARRKNRELKEKMIAARDFANRSVDNNIFNLQDDQMNDALANFSAFGGPIDQYNPYNMGAIGYDFMSDYLTTKRKQAEQKDTMANLFAGSPSTMFAIGGDLQTNSADWSTGLTHIDAGSSHEMNPNDGVQMGVDSEGVPNLVEEGEVVYDDYVFSNRIPVDQTTKEKFHLPKKKDITYAELAKKLEKEISERVNDPISKAGFKAQMLQLEEQQERQKQEMEAQRAKEAFESLSPEEQVAVMDNAVKQEAMAQQAAMQQPSPEEVAMAEQQAMQADGSQAMVGQEPPMMAEGGHLFVNGGKELIYKLAGSHTDDEFDKWAKLNKIDQTLSWEDMLKDAAFRGAISRGNPALAHALANDYDFGVFTPNNTGNVTFKDINKGNWTAQDYEGWKDSQDPAWLEAVEKGLVKKGMTQEDIAKALRQTDSYKRGSKWLQDSEDNRLRYLRTILDDKNSPEVAKNYARKFIDANGWKQGAARDYASIFGTDGKGVRETHPGTYWHTPVEAVRGAQAKNFVIGDDGKVDEIIGDVPTDWTAAGNYSWATPESDVTYNYYRRPVAQATSETPEQEEKKADESSNLEPVRKPEWMRYAGLFGPAAGLGMMAAGIGKPDYSDLDAAVTSSGNVRLADYQPLGDYLTYNPMDIWFEQNALNAQSRATDRAILNASSPSRNAALLANGYNSQLASGDLYRKALEYNDAKRKDVAEFNRGTNQFNADAFNRNSQFNASAVNDALGRSVNARLHAAQTKLNNDADWNNSLYGNVAGLFKGIGDLGVENKRDNMINWMLSKGIFGAVDPEDKEMKSRVKPAANGGKIGKKKGKRGLTF